MKTDKHVVFLYQGYYEHVIHQFTYLHTKEIVVRIFC